MRGGRWRAAVAALVLCVLTGCDVSYGPGNLKTGDRIDDVRRRMGAATDETRLPDGGRVWWYVRGPQGFHTWKVVFDRDERIASIEQVLTEANFRKIEAGKSTQGDVLALLGRPREKMPFPNLKEEVWTWRYQDGTINKYLHVHFDTAGIVTRYALEQETTSP